MNLTKLVKRSLPGTFLLMSLMVNGQQGKPNIVFILADDLGWADLPVYGNKFNEAPNLGKLAKEGMRFTNAYAASPVCSPTRASIMSGQYPARVGIIDWIPGHWRPYEEVVVPSNRTQYLPGEIETIGEALKKTGYNKVLDLEVIGAFDYPLSRQMGIAAEARGYLHRCLQEMKWK